MRCEFVYGLTSPGINISIMTFEMASFFCGGRGKWICESKRKLDTLNRGVISAESQLIGAGRWLGQFGEAINVH